MIPVYKPYFPKGALRYAHDALASTWVSSKGKYLDMVKEKLKERYGTPYIILTNNGTTANHLMARAMKEKYNERTTIIVPNNVYVAAWNPFIEYGFNLEYYDASIHTWNMNFDNMSMPEHWSKIILVVHNLGNTVNVPALRRHYPKAVIIEDACESFGGLYEGKPVGTASEAFTLSFFGNKNVTSGEGGAFITYDKELYEIAYQYWGQGVPIEGGQKFIHAGIGNNYRMTNVEAAILLGQLELWPEIHKLKKIIWQRYDEAFKDNVKFVLQEVQVDTTQSRWMYGLRIKNHTSFEKANQFFKSHNVEIRPMFYPMNYHGHLKESGDITIAERLAKEIIVLPSYPSLTLKEQNYVIEMVLDYVR